MAKRTTSDLGAKQASELSLKTVLKVSVLSFAMFGASILFPSSAALAQDTSRQFSAIAGEKVAEAQSHAEAEAFESALGLLNTTLTLPDLTAYERSTIYQMLGQYHYEIERFEDSIAAFQSAIQAGGLLPQEVDKIELSIAQLMIGNGQYREGAERLEKSLNKMGRENLQYVELLIQAWVQADDYQRALPWAEYFFVHTSPKSRKHYDLLNFLYNSLNQTDKQIDLVEQMVSQWPEDKNLWSIWASILANNGQEEEAFEVNKMFYLGGGDLDEPELLKIVQYYSFYDTPYQAAQILETEMLRKRITRTPETLMQLSDLFRQAREYDRAIPILAELAKTTGKAKPFADWGEALYNQGDCDAAEKAFTEAINRGYDAGKSWMLIANCRYDQSAKLDRLDCSMTEDQVKAAPISLARARAVQAFEKVPQTSGEYDNAKKWLAFIDSERAAFDRRCGFEIMTTGITCIDEIMRAYDAVFISGKFKLDNADVCMAYKDEYDAKYRNGLAKR